MPPVTRPSPPATVVATAAATAALRLHIRQETSLLAAAKSVAVGAVTDLLLVMKLRSTVRGGVPWGLVVWTINTDTVAWRMSHRTRACSRGQGQNKSLQPRSGRMAWLGKVAVLSSAADHAGGACVRGSFLVHFKWCCCCSCCSLSRLDARVGGLRHCTRRQDLFVVWELPHRA